MNYTLENRFEKDGLVVSKQTTVSKSLMERFLKTVIFLIERNPEKFCKSFIGVGLDALGKPTSKLSEAEKFSLRGYIQSISETFTHYESASKQLQGVVTCFLNIRTGKYIDIWANRPEITLEDVVGMLERAVIWNAAQSEDVNINKLHKNIAPVRR